MNDWAVMGEDHGRGRTPIVKHNTVLVNCSLWPGQERTVRSAHADSVNDGTYSTLHAQTFTTCSKIN
eukprot:835953-Alexandrium_andersonii.AAC.1